MGQLHRMGWVWEWGMEVHNRDPKTAHYPGAQAKLVAQSNCTQSPHMRQMMHIP